MEQCKIRGKNTAHNDLSLGSNVPEFHFKCQRHAQRRNQKWNHDFDRRLYRHLASQRSGYNRLINDKWILPNQQDKESACHQSQHDRLQTEDQCFSFSKFRLFYNADPRFFHACSSFFSDAILLSSPSSPASVPVIISPSCSFVSFFASTIPVIFPWQSTMIRSESSRSTSRSSPI